MRFTWCRILGYYAISCKILVNGSGTIRSMPSIVFTTMVGPYDLYLSIMLIFNFSLEDLKLILCVICFFDRINISITAVVIGEHYE